MITRQDILIEARSWIGTPHVWQASVKGRGCDCKGLVAGVARELGMEEAASAYAAIGDYRKVDCALLREGMETLFDRVDEMTPGDVLILKMAHRPQHLAIFDGDKIIHTYAHGPQAVTATNSAASLRLWPVDSIWAWKGVT